MLGNIRSSYWKPPILLPNKSFVRSKVRFPLFLLCKNCNFWATANTVWARNLKFGHSTLLVILQKRFFLFFEFLIFSKVMPLFVFFSIYSLLICPRATANTVWARNLKFGHSTLLVTLQKPFFYFFEFLIFSKVMALLFFVFCPRATANTVWARNLKFGHSTLLVTLQKRVFCFFEFLIFSKVMPLFVFFCLYILC